MKTRPYREQDRERMHEITAASFQDAAIQGNIEAVHGALRGTSWAERKCVEIDADIETEPEGVLMAEDEDGTVVGYITTTTDEVSGIGRIPNVAVAPNQQGKGVGKMLINAALDRFEDKGMEFVKIETLATNETGQALYPRFGFREIARQIHYIMRTDDARRL